MTRLRRTWRGTACLLIVLLLANLLWSQEPPPRASLEQARDAAKKAFGYLLSRQQADGTWLHLAGPYLEADLGATALVSLALQSADRESSQKAVAKADAAIAANLDKIKSTYSLSLVIIYKERNKQALGNLVQRLILGQDPENGGWGYNSPRQGKEPVDNSNTQLAVLALIIVRMNGHATTAVGAALDRAQQRFRETQFPSGGWHYSEDTAADLGKTTISMTFAGLLGLAAGIKDWSGDVVVHGNQSGKGASLREDHLPNDVIRLRKDPKVILARDYILGGMPKVGRKAPFLTYTLWSMERVAFLYGERTFFGEFDWYQFGTDLLVSIQREDGSWFQDIHSEGNADTAFALLFLKRVNFLEVVVRSDNITGLPRSGNGAPTVSGFKTEKGTKEEAARLAAEMEGALATRVEEILSIMESRSDHAYRDALLEIIQNPKVKFSNRRRAEQALANWISWHSATTVSKYLTDLPWEMRVAAVRAIQMAGYRELIPNLIDRLADEDRAVSAEAELVLKELTKQDLGKDPAAWKRWYAQLPKKP